MFRKIKQHTISFKHAFDGIRYAFSSQPNFQIHTVVALLVIGAGMICKISKVEWLLLWFTILWVLLSEMINTALESIVDLVTNEYRQEAKIAKDVAAGAVLLGAMGSVVVGLFVFVPYIIRWIHA